MLVLTLALVALAVFGHAAFWVGVINRWHAIGFPRWVTKSVALLFYAALLVPLAAAGWFMLSQQWPSVSDGWQHSSGVTAYLVIAAAYGAAHIPLWARERWRSRVYPSNVRLDHDRIVDIARQVGFAPIHGFRAAMFHRVPGNQLCQLHVSEFSIFVPGLPSALEGLSICHWSDLHYSGRIDRAYYREITRLTNELQPDLLALTGDICDKARYIDWIGESLGPAVARLGKFFILGNHDLRTHDVGRLRSTMEEAGFRDLGGRCEVLHEGQIVVAGDERPWFKAVPSPPEPAALPDAVVRILLAHTPDQLGWARAERFDVMLAGHTHGGQIRFPLVGPVLCPSWHGTKYASGFYDEPPTLLHVSRGTASLLPLRLNCPPEITKLVLRAHEPGASADRFFRFPNRADSGSRGPWCDA